MRALHVFSSSATRPEQRFLGTTKDLRGRTQYFAERGIESRELILEAREERCLLDGLRQIDLRQIDFALIEGTYFPASAAALKAANPRLKVLLRGVNAEALHWLHSVEASLRFGAWRRALFDMKSTFEFGAKDILCARRADYILPIADWETRHYWPCLAPRARVVTLPYFLPDSYLRDIPAARAKSPRVVCMMTTKADRSFLVDAARNFYGLVNDLGASESQWTFTITGDFHSASLPTCPRVEVAGILENPLELLAESRAIALLSDYGFGFKTKLLEAIRCGCRALVTGKLFERLPGCLQPLAIVVDPTSVESFREALDRSLEPFPPGDVNAELRAANFAALDAILGMEPVSRQQPGGPARRDHPTVSAG